MITVLPGAQPALATDGLTARWTLDEGTGDVVNDAVGVAGGTRAGGATWLFTSVAEGSGALRFDGVDGRVQVPNTSALEPEQLTITAWVRGDPANPPDVGSVLVEKGAFGCTGPSYGLYVGAEGIVLRSRDPLGGSWSGELAASTAGVSLWDGAWHLVAAAIPTADVAPRIGIDGYGVAVWAPWYGGEVGHITYAGTSATGFSIGGPVVDGCGEPFFAGDIDDIRINRDAAAFWDAGYLMPPIPTTVVMAPIDPTNPGRYVQVVAHVSPVRLRLLGQVRFDLVEAGTQRQIRQEMVSINPQGDATIGVTASEVGEYNLTATAVIAPPYLASSDTEAVSVVSYPTATTLGISPSSPLPTEPVTLTADVSGPSQTPPGVVAPGGAVMFVDTATGTDVVLGSAMLDWARGSGLRATLNLPGGLPLGAHDIEARYAGDAIYAPSTSSAIPLAIGAASSWVTLYAPASAQAHHLVSLQAAVGAPINGWETDATISFLEDGRATPLAVVPARADNLNYYATSSLSVGTHVIRAVYSGNSLVSGSQSEPWTLTVTPDEVEATGVGVALTAFYPYKDGYRDTVSVRGTRSEPIGVAIKVYSPTGRTVKSATVPRASGAYSVAWNGRTSSGTMLAAGKYKVVQTLTDAFGTTKRVTSYVTLSAKRLYYTTTYITKLGSSYSSKGTYGTGKVVISTAGGYAKLVAPGSYWSNWAGVGYQFTLPSATVYKSIAFQVYMRGLWWSGPNQIKMQNFSLCPLEAGAWNEACFDHAGGLGAYTSAKTWKSTTGSPTLNRSGRTVRGMAGVVAGTYYIYKARVKVTYGVLR